jgi:hypothetical protein
LEIRSIHNPGNLVSHIQMFSPGKPVSMLFDACEAIDKGRSGGIGCDCGGLTWERAYKSNDKYMCQGDNSWPSDDVGSYYCPYWSCASWATCRGLSLQPSVTKGKLPLTAPLAPVTVNFTVLKPSDWTWGRIIGIRIDGKGLDLGSLMHLKLVTVMRVPLTKFFTPFMRRRGVNFPSLPKRKTCSSHWLSL